MAKKIYSWGKFLNWIAEEVVYPSNLQELKNTILQAKSRRLKIRVGGSLHTLNEQLISHEIQVFTNKLNRVLSLDKTQLLVKAEGGIKLHALTAYLATHSLSLPNQSYILEQSLAGALATATHGTGKTGTLCSFVEEIEVVDSNGSLRTLSPKENLHLFNAALVNLGSCGIVYSITLKLIPVRKLLLRKTETNLENALNALPELLHNNEHTLVFINPYSDQAVINSFQTTSAKPHNVWLLKFKWYLRKMVASASMNFGIPYPFFLIRPTVTLFLKLSKIKSAVDYNYKILSPDDGGHWVEEEINVPLEELENALKDVLAIIQKYAQNKASAITVVVLRFVNPDSHGYLSPSLGRASAYISMISIRKRGYSKLFNEVEEALYKYRGRPHWGKVHFLTKEKVAELYGSNVNRFIKAKEELDPEGMFINEYIDNLF